MLISFLRRPLPMIRTLPAYPSNHYLKLIKMRNGGAKPGSENGVLLCGPGIVWEYWTSGGEF